MPETTAPEPQPTPDTPANAPAAAQPPRRRPWLRWAPGLILLLAVVYQLASLAPGVFRQGPRLFGDLGQPALWRGARSSQGYRFADYIAFLHQNIPPGAWVVLPPPTAGSKAIANTPLMQFFLLPRRVINCTDYACIKNLSLVDTYVLVVNDFPGVEILSLGQGLRFSDEWGLFMLPDNAPQQLFPLTGYTRGLQIIRDVLLPCVWMFILALAGYVAVALLLPGWRNPAGLALGFSLGMAALTALLALASLAGIPLSLSLTTSATLFLLALALVFLWRYTIAAAEQGGRPTSIVQYALRIDLWQVLFLLAGGIVALFSVGQGYSATDEIVLWGIKGYGMATTGSIRSVTSFGTNTVPYPLHIPLSIAAARLAFGEALPASKLIFPVYYVALAFLLDRLLVEIGLRRALAGLATLLAGTAPLIFRHGALAYANLPLAFYIVAAVGILAQALAVPGGQRQSAGAFALSGVLFATAAWTRPEGLIIAWLLLGALAGAAYLLDRRGFRWRVWAALFVPPVVYTLFWTWLKALVYTQPLGRSNLAGDALRWIAAGNLHLRESLYLLRNLLASTLSLETWGWLGPAALLLAILSLARIAWHSLSRLPARASQKDRQVPRSPAFIRVPADRISLLFFLAGLVYFAAVLGMYYLTSFTSNRDLSWWVNTGLERMWMPGLLLLWIGGTGLAQVFYHQQDRPAPAHLV